jgi:hypothetical protein
MGKLESVVSQQYFPKMGQLWANMAALFRSYFSWRYFEALVSEPCFWKGKHPIGFLKVDKLRNVVSEPCFPIKVDKPGNIVI